MKEARDWTPIHFVAQIIPMLAGLPAAYMVGRSVWHWLILGWFASHTEFMPWLGAVIALISAIVIEGLGTVSLFLWSSFRRWNTWKATRINDDGERVVKKGYDLAPSLLAFVCFVGYIIVGGCLLGVLEWKSEFANFAPVLFVGLTTIGGLSWSMYAEHRDRLSYHGIAWNWVAKKEDVPETPKKESETTKDEPRKDEKKPQLDETDIAILKMWRDNPAMSQVQIGKVAGVSNSTVSRRKAELQESGLLQQTEKGMKVLWGNNGHA